MAMALFTGLNGAISLNDIVPVYPEPEASEIENYIIDGAALFLSSYSDALLILQEYEISSRGALNTTAALINSASALKKLRESRVNYSKALEIADKINYVDFYKNKLKIYSYESVMSEDNLNAVIADEVISFLKEGDVKGLYRRNLEKIDKTIKTLEDIYSNLNGGNIPKVSVFWNLLQRYGEAALFGNYSTLLAKRAFNLE